MLCYTTNGHSTGSTVHACDRQTDRQTDRPRYRRHTACSFPGLTIPTLEYKYIFRIKYTETILSNSTQKLLRLEITEKRIAV